MPWLGHAPDAPDTHRMWADPDSAHEAALHASGWCHEVPAPGSDELLVNDPPAELVPTEPAPPLTTDDPPVEQKPRTRRRNT